MAKAGRKRKSGIKRQPNGQPSRSVTEQRDNAKATVIDARRRFYKLGRETADSDLAGYVIGRMALQGHFGRSYMRAINCVEDYCNAVVDYMRFKVPMHPIPKAMDYFAARGKSLTEEPSRSEVARVEKRYTDLCGKLSKADGIDRMWFHNAAFHDIEPPIPAKDGIIRCVNLLKD